MLIHFTSLLFTSRSRHIFCVCIRCPKGFNSTHSSPTPFSEQSRNHVFCSYCCSHSLLCRELQKAEKTKGKHFITFKPFELRDFDFFCVGLFMYCYVFYRGNGRELYRARDADAMFLILPLFRETILPLF